MTTGDLMRQIEETELPSRCTAMPMSDRRPHKANHSRGSRDRRPDRPHPRVPSCGNTSRVAKARIMAARQVADSNNLYILLLHGDQCSARGRVNLPTTG